MLNHRYDGLEGDWAEYAQVAQKFIRARWASIPPDDAEDLVQRIILAMHQVAQKTGRGPGGWLWVTARYELSHYWRERAHRPHISLNKELQGDGNGKVRELWETLAAPEADLDAQLNARIWLAGCSDKVMGIARKLAEGETLTESERGYIAWWRRRVGIPTPRSGHKKSSSQAHEIKLPLLRVTVYRAICVVLGRSPTPLHEKEIVRLVAEAYPPLARSIKNFNRQMHATLCKRQRNGVCEREIYSAFVVSSCRPCDSVAWPDTTEWKGAPPDPWKLFVLRIEQMGRS